MYTLKYNLVELELLRFIPTKNLGKKFWILNSIRNGSLT